MADKKPNVILVLTDDQGYGDLGCTGNKDIKTPNIDKFYNDSLHFTDYHVAPLCAPSRGAIFSGRRPLRNGVFATCWGRSILHEGETTVAEVFRDNGYATGLFGKWHLGDNYPYRPQDRGFQEVVAHKGGGVGQTPDFWGNSYFDDVYFKNGKPTKYDGYCTDVWFDVAEKFIKSHKDEPFFACITTNAPHSPYLVSEKYTAPYRNNDNIVHPEFYGMISSIDENFAKLREKLSEWDLEDNTILIFMTDNGSSGGCETDKQENVTRGYNASMRGKKASYYDGGHRVPFFIRWPKGGLVGGKDIDYTSFHVDFFPTMVDLCSIKMPNLKLDGISLKPALNGQPEKLPKERMEFMQFHQAPTPPCEWEGSVICDDWRLVRGTELYNIKTDPSEKTDLSSKYPQIVKKMRAANEDYWQDMQKTIKILSPIYLGDEHENPTRLDAMDLMGDVTWNQITIAVAKKSSGSWKVKFTQKGKYRFELRRWPSELNLAIDENLPDDEIKKLAPYNEVYNSKEGLAWKNEHKINAVKPTIAKLKFFDKCYDRVVNSKLPQTTFELDVEKVGETDLTASFIDQKGIESSAYYVYVERLN